MRRKNDILWKGILEEVFEDLLRFVFPAVDKELDLQRGFEFLDKELAEMYPEPEKASQTRFVDKLVKVYLRDGGERWMLLHVEVQSAKDSQFSRRMFQYYYRIWDRYGRPVSAIAIFTGRDGKTMPHRFEDHCLGTHTVYQYNTLCVTDYTDEVLSASENPFAIVILAAKKALLTGKNVDQELFEQKLLIVKLLQTKGIFSKLKIKAILTFLQNYVLFKDSKLSRIFIEQVDKITDKNYTMGIIEQVAEMRAAEGLKKGMQKGMQEGMQKGMQKGLKKGLKKGQEEGEKMTTRLIVENLLKDSDFSLQKIASLTNVTVDFVKKVKKELNSK